jgi:cobalt-precorrin 5A hydrolase
VIYRPKTLVLGIGCDRGTPPELVRRGVQQLMQESGLSLASVAALTSADVKADEPALLQLAAEFGWRFLTYASADLDQVTEIVTPSDVVKRHVGTRSVSEASAILGGRTVAREGAMAAPPEEPRTELLAPKRIYKEPGIDRAMTFAVARLVYPTRRAFDAQQTVVSQEPTP